MARKTTVYLSDKGRDSGKAFLLTEMPAMQQLKWGYRAFISLVNAGVSLPEGSGDMGMAVLIGIAFQELKKGLEWEQLEPLIDELMECVQYIPNPNDKSIVRRIYENDIEEAMTLFALQSEVIKLHTNFTQQG